MSGPFLAGWLMLPLLWAGFYKAKKKLTNFKGKIIYNKKFPDGTLNKNLDSTLIKKLKWKTKIKFLSGLKKLVDKKQSQIKN